MNQKRFLKDQELDLNLKNSVKKEREILSEILTLILEINRRKLFLSLGFSSLFDYLTAGVGYSAGSAMRRIEAIYLMTEIPEVSEQITKGSINLAQISEIQKAGKELMKIKPQEKSKITETKREVIAQLLELTPSAEKQKETQKICAKTFDLPLVENTQQKIQKDESVRIELTLSKLQYEKLQTAKELLSHVIPDGDLRALIEYLSDKVIEQKKMTAAPKKIYREVLSQHQTCQYIDTKTKNRCVSKWKLEVDHVQPRWAGGTDAATNLTVLCAAHNKFMYRQQAGLS